MKPPYPRLARILAAVAATVGLTGTATGALIAINFGSVPNPDTFPSSSGDSQILSWLQTDVATYNSVNSASLPVPQAHTFRNNQGENNFAGYPTFGNDVLSLTVPTGGFSYIVLHWGGNRDRIDTYQSFYIGDPGTDTSYTFNAPAQNGLSWYSLHNPGTPPDDNPPGEKVPDSGGTLLMLGSAICGCGLFRKFAVRA